MKFLFSLALSLFLFAGTQAQNIFYKPGEKHDFYRDITNWNGGPEFEVTEVPEKWKNESGVILAYKSQEHINIKGAMGYRTLSYRYRIKIQDKAAVESFSSTFSKDMGDNFEIKIVKPDGTEIFLDPDDLEGYQADASTDKFSIPNLEAGDILDYYYSGSDTFAKAYAPRMYSFSNVDEEFPMLYKEIEWLLHKNIEFKCKSTNGVPALEEHWYDKKGNKVSDPNQALFRQVTIKQRDIERQADARYVYNAQVIPFVRYRMFTSPINYMKFVNASTRLKKTETSFMTYKDIGDFVYNQQKQFKTSYKIRTLMNIYDKNIIRKGDGRTTEQTMDVIKAIHHAVKYQAQPIAKYEDDAGASPSSIHRYGLRMSTFSSLWQIFSFANEFDEHDIDYDIIAITPKNFGRIEEVMFENELKYAIRVNLPDGTKFFYSGHGIYNDYNVNNYLFEGAKGIVVEPKKARSETVKFEEVVFPVSSYTENVNEEIKTITFSDDFQILEVNNEKSYTGKLKINESFRILRLPDIFETYCNEFRVTPKKNWLIVREKDNVAKKIKTERIEKYKKELEDNFEVDSYDDISIINSGIKEGEPLVINEKYSLDGLVKKAGNKYILNAGLLIGSQVALEDDEYERTLDVFSSYPRSFINECIFTIPDGYTVEDLSPLNTKTDNEAGMFESTCVLEGNKLIFRTEKNYKVNFLKAEKWPLMTAFLDAAFDLTQKKILISKI